MRRLLREGSRKRNLVEAYQRLYLWLLRGNLRELSRLRFRKVHPWQYRRGLCRPRIDCRSDRNRCPTIVSIRIVRREVLLTSSRTINRTLLTTKGHFLPYLSAANPKIIEPTDLNINTRVIPHVMSVFETLKSTAKSETVKLTVKKSKASQDCLMSQR